MQDIHAGEADFCAAHAQLPASFYQKMRSVQFLIDEGRLR
jgi:hypothetical protein